MKKAPLCCAALAAALVLLLCACRTSPAEQRTAADLSAFEAAFDLSDLAQYLTEDQLAAVDAAVWERLAAQGYPPESYALQFENPTAGSIKIPFDNAGGRDLARLDTAKLADYIAGEIAAELDKQGIKHAGATGSATTATKQPSSGSTGGTAITTTTTTTKHQQEMYPQELLLDNNQIINISNSNNIAGTVFSQYANGGFNLAFNANGQTYVFRRADALNEKAYYESQFKNGKTETVALYVKTGQKDGKVALRLIDTYSYTVGGDTAGYDVYVVPDRNDTTRYSGLLYTNSINIRVGGNTGMNFTYWVHPDTYTIPDKKTIFLN
ncbi:MAG: hypothetical protein FWC27_07785 [Firmicutes bacterium]|nr:hypothetical protein [Bacillota bacterium]